MTAYRFVTLTCDGCGEIHDSGMAVTFGEARRSAAVEGWVRWPGGQDCCGICNGTHERGPDGTTWRKRTAPAPV